jgi:trigger factor
MPIEVQQEQLEPCKVALNIQVPPDQVARTLDSVFNQFAKRVTVPGFRRGKAPRKLVERYIDQDAVKEAAVEKLVRDGFRQALEQTGIQPYDQASVEAPEFLEDEAFRFKATVPLRPDVQLGDFKGIEVRRTEVAITEGDVDRELARIREQAARFEEVDGPSQEGDRLQANVRVTVDGQAVEDATAENAWLLVGSNFPEFDRGILGIAPGEERTFTFTYPADVADAERAGKQAEAAVKAEKVQRRIVPELEDSFAQSLGHDNLDALRAEIRSQLQEAAARQADDFVERDLLEQVVRRATINFPESMVDEEVAERMSALIKGLERRRLTMEDYLRSVDKDLATLEKEYAEDARRQIKNSLVLLRIAEENELKLEEADIEAELQRRAQAASADPAMMRRLLEDQGEMDRLRNQVFFRKVLDYLKSVSNITEAA